MADQQPAYAQPIAAGDLVILRDFVDTYIYEYQDRGETWVKQLAIATSMLATLDEAIAKAVAECKEVEAFDREFPPGSLI